MGPGTQGGGWPNFLFQGDAAHYVNHSSNTQYESTPWEGLQLAE